jgi:hypothetical protein
MDDSLDLLLGLIAVEVRNWFKIDYTAPLFEFLDLNKGLHFSSHWSTSDYKTAARFELRDWLGRRPFIFGETWLSLDLDIENLG